MNGIYELNHQLTMKTETPPEKKKWYTQTFKSSWMSDPEFKDWLKPYKDDKYACYCICCSLKLNKVKRSSLMKHKNSIKHKNNFNSVGGIATAVDVTQFLHKKINDLEESDGEECDQDLHYSIAEETTFDNDFLLLDNGSLQPLKTPPEVTKKTPKKVPKRISIQNKTEPAPKKTKLYETKAPKETSQQSTAFRSTSDEYKSFGNIVAAHLRSLSTIHALESQNDILQYLVQKRLGRRPMFVTNPEYVEQECPTIHIQATCSPPKSYGQAACSPSKSLVQPSMPHI